MDYYNRFLYEPTYARNIVPVVEQRRREASAGYVEGKRPPTGPPRPELISPHLTPLTLAAVQALSNAPPPYQP